MELGAHNVLDDSLEENYRSTVNIINFNNHLFTELPQILQRQLNGNIDCLDDNGDMEAWWKQKGFDHIVTDVYAAATQKLTPKTLEGGTIKCLVLKEDSEGNAVNKNNFMDQAILRMLDEIRDLIEVRKYKLKDICVLVRKNSEAIAVVKALLESGINVISGEALLIVNNPSIKLILNTLNVLAGLPNNTALYKANCISLYARLQGRVVETSSFFDLKLKTLAQLSQVLPPELCQHWQTWLQQPLPELVEKIIEVYGLAEKDSQLPYLFAFRDLAGNFARQGEKGVASFLRYWEEEGLRKTLPSSESADAVQVVTIHKSKGLAFKAVMLPFCNWEINGKTNSIFWVPSAGTPYHHLQSIPLKYNKDLGNSSVAKAYFEELLFNNMDALNMLYVAATRSKEYLYISTVGKKTDTITNIGDLLLKTLEAEISEEGEYIIDNPVDSVYEDEESTGIIKLEHYPTSDRLSQVFNAGLKRSEIQLLTGNNAGRLGSILHEVLALAAQAEDIDRVLTDLLASGLFKSEEREDLRVQASAVLSNKDLQDLLKQGKYSLTEQTIIDTKGKSYRPDKVLITEKGVTIIDYKFTLEESSTHIEQVEHYRQLLLAMGYSNVETYLFYAVTGKLKQV
jgi:ATP-dependent helicase/nuclease subunit A